MKKTLIALTLAAAIPAAVLASSGERGPHDRGPNVERMSEMLDLSDEQRTQLRALFEEQAAEREAMRNEMRARMSKLLTPEQQARMDEMREKRREHRKARHERRHERRHDCDRDKERES